MFKPVYQVCNCFGECLKCFDTLQEAKTSGIEGTIFYNYKPGYYRECLE